MAREPNITSARGRGRLEAHKKPYWRTIYEGLHVGYRKGTRSETWYARWWTKEPGKPGTYTVKRLGPVEPEGMTYAQAVEAAKEMRDFEQGTEVNHEGKPYTVADALHDYTVYQKREGKDVSGTKRRIETDIKPVLGDVPLRDLTKRQVESWLQGLANREPRARPDKHGKVQTRGDLSTEEARRRRRSSANRTLTILKAALNRAYRDEKAPSDKAWARVQPFKGADTARVQYLTLDECRRLLGACEPAFRPLVQAALHTGARYGELIGLNVRDFDRDAGAIFVAESKSGKPRRIYLADEGLAFFEAQVAGRRPDEPMFKRKDGHRWAKSHAQRPLARACEAAGIAPTTFHALRHTYASHAVMAGAPLMVVAENLGHSDTRMVEKHYGHLAESYVKDTIKRTAPKFGNAAA